MQKFVIQGGRRLTGEIRVQGAKNSALPILAAALLCKGESCLENCPRLSDVFAACRILTGLGCRCRIDGETVTVRADPTETAIPEALMQEMRSSIIFLGAALGRMGACTLGYPGGCELGPRPIDLHLAGLRRMGARITEENGCLHCTAPGGLHGARIHLQFPSVGATENLLLAAVTAKGETILTNAAREPEIADLAAYLNRCGACIEGAGCSTVRVQGVGELTGCTYRIMPDRIAAATWLAAAAVTGGELCLRDADAQSMESILDVLDQMHCRCIRMDDRICIAAARPLRAVRYLKTMPYPGFPTDAQAIVTAPLCIADGTSVVEESIFENRFRHTDALVKMGADIRIAGRAAVIRGVPGLHGAQVCATDLRGGAAMLIAALGAQGETVLTGLQHIDRGYDSPEHVLRSVGAGIRRE
ncbi:MAG: UDP-N-acetylglucosamine 1-carboxyvinyltransferase [Oscillospiraceae bacterium]|nr:UDP-N-acetylglucosamine 1-carboxyvinyltransferase [Oscillospiraceae bacterium]MBQ9695165.1 UDP-N-acetylglucosamine 1-carboxyvinyltransferase [Oscillospiraceae bacterium]MBR1899031.1 UDP-N-acetylglucosamine 1-carboxyvinyltransferase [Oscillospiraceae bacterium]